MKFCKKSHDGGKDSGVTGYWLVEIKWLFSIVLLKFNKGSREAFHSHAFNAFTWWIKGSVTEHFVDGSTPKMWKPSWKPKYTPRDEYHKIIANEVSYAISFRGPWSKFWKETKGNTETILTNGRKEVSSKTK